MLFFFLRNFSLFQNVKMASNKQKKVVSQDQLRRLMREKQYSAKTITKRIEHPLAKYNSLDQLVCTLCNMIIKSDNLWVAHIQSKQHKEKYMASKTQGPAKPENMLILKRKFAEVEMKSLKKTKGMNGFTGGTSEIPADFHDDKFKVPETGKVSALLEYSSSESSSEDTDNEEKVKILLPATSTSKVGTLDPLPDDFFDPRVKSDKAEADSKPLLMADALPEGFFDDPKMDAKVRQVEYKDKMEEEWELFQKSMKEETHMSEAIIEEEDEQTNVERDLDQIDEQIQCWKEVEDLHIKKEIITKVTGEGPTKVKRHEHGVDEDDLSEFLDWRSKKSWK